MKFTKETVAALTRPPDKTDHIEWDDALPGFGVRLRGGTKRWVVQYRAGTQQRRESLGDLRKVGLEDARKVARQRFAQVQLGGDPAADRLRARARASTLGVVINLYLESKRDRLRTSTFKAATRYFAVHWKPLHDHPLDAIVRAVVAGRLQELIKAHGRTSTARARNNLSALFTWAMKEGLCEFNPVTATNDPTEGTQARDRVLSDDEIRIFWKACGDDAAGRVAKLLLLTGCRRDEIGALRWSEIEAGVLTVPGTRTKNGRALVLPLPAVAINLIAEVPKQGNGDFVFGRGGGTPFSGWSAAKLRLDACIAITNAKPLAPWTLHDLRRTMRSGLGMLGVAPHVAELAINHVKGGVEAIYDRYRYQREIGTALARWSDHVLALVEGRKSNVVAFQSV
jgi:integrase